MSQASLLWSGLLLIRAMPLFGAGTPLSLHPVLAHPDTDSLIAQGDLHYGRREEDRTGQQAGSREILEAISAYERASEDPGSAQARWKLARALYFRGAYTGLDPDSRRRVFEKARRVSEEAISILSSRRGRSAAAGKPSEIADLLRGEADASATFFWAAVSWGEWALSMDRLDAVKTGAAARIRDDATIVILLDPRFEEGGGYRILGRLHDRAPRIPLLTWWVSRKEGLANLRRAVAVAPANLINLHFLAEALVRAEPARRPEAIHLEEKVAAADPSPTRLVEEIHIQEQARRNLIEWRR